MRARVVEVSVGLFIMAGVLGLIALAFKVSGLTGFSHGDYYTVSAEFDNIGDLKVRAPVVLAGVRIGDVVAVTLDKNNFRAKVQLRISKQYNNLPIDTSASILTEGILGSNYIALAPGFESASLQQSSMIETTQSALVLENLIGQLIYSLKSGNNAEADAPATTASQPVAGR